MKKLILLFISVGNLMGCTQNTRIVGSPAPAPQTGQDGRGGFEYYYDKIPDIKQNVAQLAWDIKSLPAGELEYLLSKYPNGKNTFTRDDLAKIVAAVRYSPAAELPRKDPNEVLTPLKMNYDLKTQSIEFLRPFFDEYKNIESTPDDEDGTKARIEFDRQIIHEALHLYDYDEKDAFAFSTEIANSLFTAQFGCGFSGSLQERETQCQFRYPTEKIPFLSYYHTALGETKLYLKANSLYIYKVGLKSEDMDGDVSRHCNDVDTMNGQLEWRLPTRGEAQNITLSEDIKKRLTIDKPIWTDKASVYVSKGFIFTKPKPKISWLDFNDKNPAPETSDIYVICVADVP